MVIVLNWNGWRDTLRCLSSLDKLRYENFEVVVIDNGSTDDSGTHIKSAYPHVALIETGKNLGFAGGNNVGIRYAIGKRADYIWLLNNDTVASPGALVAMVDAAQRDPSVGVVGSVLCQMGDKDVIQAYGGGRVIPWAGMSRPFVRPVPDERLEYINGASMLIKRCVIEEVGLLDSRFFMYWEDVDYGFRARKAGWQLAVASKAKIWHDESSSLGRRSPVLDAYFNTSSVLFFGRHHILPFVPILAGVGGRLLKRLAQRDLTRAKAVWRGAAAGLLR
jgi:GT2 family glycosyltransferase